MKHVQGHVTSCSFSNSATQIDKKFGRMFARRAILLLVTSGTCQKALSWVNTIAGNMPQRRSMAQERFNLQCVCDEAPLLQCRGYLPPLCKALPSQSLEWSHMRIRLARRRAR